MEIFVDQCIYPFGRMLMCHMMAYELEDLHKMAKLLELKPRWFQNKNCPHYDICKSKKVQAISLGAKPFESREQQVELIRYWRECKELL